MATTDKYDRQLRLWGASGQRALGSTTVALFGASAAGTETLKNLVLPGVGAIHVVDDAGSGSVPVAAEGGAAFGDFFVFRSEGGEEDDCTDTEGEGGEEKKEGSGGRSRAEVACANLMELNPDVNGGHTTVPSLEAADYPSLLEKIQEDSGREKLLAVASDLPPSAVLPLSKACYAKSIPLLIVRSYGLVGTVRVQVRRHVVVESKPDSSVPDLRLAEPGGLFPQLRALVDATDLEKMDSKEHGHVPYVVLLVKAMEKWRGEKKMEKSDDGGGDAAAAVFPKTTEEKSQFREAIKSMARKFDDELNFKEAYNDSYLAYARKEVPWEVQELLDAASSDAMDTDGDSVGDGGNGGFDVLVLALKKFMDGHGGQPPLNGSIPDMTAATEPYVALQGAYRSKADEDRAEMRRLVEEVRSGRGGGAPEVTDEELATFCKNVHNLRTLETRSYAEEYGVHSPGSGDGAAVRLSALEQDIRDDLLAATADPYEVPEHTPLLWHVAVRACDSFRSVHGRYPGLDGRELALKSDAEEVQSSITSICSAMGLSESELIRAQVLDDTKMRHAREVVRYHNAEVHTVASVVGGVASQEAVKLITGQYVPLDNTYVYNGIVGVGGVYKL